MLLGKAHQHEELDGLLGNRRNEDRRGAGVEQQISAFRQKVIDQPPAADRRNAADRADQERVPHRLEPPAAAAFGDSIAQHEQRRADGGEKDDDPHHQTPGR